VGAATGGTDVLVDVVVVAYGHADLVRACVRSVQEHAGVGVRIHVVDNASPGGLADAVERDFPDVHVVRRASNDGFAVANNEVLRSVSARYALLLNPDAALHPGTLPHLVEEMSRCDDIGMLGCRLLTADGTLDHAAKREIPRPRDAASYFAQRLLGRRGSRYLAPSVPALGVGDVGAINGAFMLVRTSALDQVGLLDEAFWMYGEDLDWCSRFRAAGWRVVYDGTVTATHLKGAVAGRSRPVRLSYHFHRSMAIFYRKNLRSGHVAVDAAVLGAIWLRFAALAVGRGGRQAVALVAGREQWRRR
jgi:GT2 family glycosyltransferase